MVPRSLPLLLATLILPAAGQAQLTRFTHYTTRDGLLSDIVNTVVQDSRGYLWVGTWEGISVFDGTTFRNLTPADGLPSTYVNCLAELGSSPGTMVAGMNLDGICFIRDFRVTPARVGSSADANRVLSLMEDSRGVLWCGTAGGLFHFRDGTATPFRPDLHLGSVTPVVETPDSTVWFLGDSGLYRFIPATGELRRVPLPIRGGASAHILSRAAGGGVWVGSTDSSIFLVEEGVVARHLLPGVLPAFFLFDDRAGHLWTRAGSTLLRFAVERVEAGGAVRHTAENGFDGTYTASALLDREGSIWFGGKGITRLDDNRLARFAMRAPPLNPYTSIAGDPAGRVWSLQGSDLVEFRHKGEDRWERSVHRLVHPDPLVVTTDRSGSIWVGYLNGDLDVLDVDGRGEGPSVLRRRRTVRAMSYAGGGQLSTLLVDRHGRAWVGLSGTGIAVLDPASPRPLLRLFGADERFPMYSVRAMLEDREGNIWAGEFGQGIAVLRGGFEGGSAWTRFTRDDGLADNAVRSLAEDREGAVWIGTRYGGLTRYAGGLFRRVGFREGLRSNAIWGIATDSMGVWLATGAGVGFLPSTVPDTVLMLEEYPRAQVSAIVPLHGGFVATATNTELGVLRTAGGRPSGVPPLVHITGVSVNGSPAGSVRAEPYRHSDNHWVFDYAGISLAAPGAVRYQYRPEGAEREWHLPTERRTITYSALPPGHYTFSVSAISGEGVHSVAPASWSFVIAPPFWAEWWFRGLVGLAAAGGVLAFFSARVRQLKREQEAQREFSRRLIAFQEKERERIGAELHDGLGQELLVVKNGLDRAAGVAGGHTDLAGSLHQLSEMVHATLREVRDISYDLHPHTLDRLGLRRAIESVAARFAAASDITITAEVEDVDGILSKEKEINLFRVAQECLNNVLRHSGARTARVTVRRLPAAVELTVEDDGKGFDAAGARPGDERGGFGLSGMRERARLLGGTWSVRTGSGAGTTITTTIPT